MSDGWLASLETLAREAGAERVTSSGEEPAFDVPVGALATLLVRLREHESHPMDGLFDLVAIDRGPEARPRFELVYRLRSSESGRRLRVRARADESDEIASSVAHWPAAGWLEREVFDLFGLRFKGHPDLRRLLLEPDFEGAPLRKDFARQPGLPVPKPVA